MITLYIGSDALLLSGKILDFVALEAEDMATMLGQLMWDCSRIQNLKRAYTLEDFRVRGIVALQVVKR